MRSQRRILSGILILLSLAVLPSASAYAQKSSAPYTFTDLGGLPGLPSIQSQAWAINDFGDIVGSSWTVGPNGDAYEHAVVWAKDASGKYAITDLGRGRATGINNLGEVVTGRGLIVPVTVDGSLVWYQDLDGDGINDLENPLGHGSALNDNTQIVQGYNVVQSDANGNVITTALPNYGEGYAINDSGQVAGSSWFPDLPSEPATIWQVDAMGNITRTQLLDPLAGASSATALCIDQLGNAAGRSEFPVPNSIGVRFRATLWINGGPPIDLGAPQRSSSEVQGARTINGALQLVGWVNNNGYYAFLWQNGKLTNLNSLVSASGVSLREADAINSSGQIVGVARVAVGKSNYEAHAFLITPK